jgi:hypothetical protein
MSNYTIEELIIRWRREELTVEQMIGQILLVLKEHEQRVRAIVRPAASADAPPAEPEQRRR